MGSSPTYTSEVIREFLSNLSSVDSSSSRSEMVTTFVKSLMEERSKLQMTFKDKLPFASRLLDEAIEYMQKNGNDVQMIKLMGVDILIINGDNNRAKGVIEERRSEAADIWTSDNNVAGRENFWPFQGDNSFSTMAKGKDNQASGLAMSSHQGTRNMGIFPYMPAPVVQTSGISFRTSRFSNQNEGGTQMTSSKMSMPVSPPRIQTTGYTSRLAWTKELQNKFVDCVQQLDGHNKATPKRIVERMQVIGLTTDHVRSHLQKYRAHQRRVQNTGTGVGGGSSSAAGDPSGWFQGNGNGSSSAAGDPSVWFQGNGNGSSSAAGDPSGWFQGNGNGSSSAAGDPSGWFQGNGNGSSSAAGDPSGWFQRNGNGSSSAAGDPSGWFQGNGNGSS